MTIAYCCVAVPLLTVLFIYYLLRICLTSYTVCSYRCKLYLHQAGKTCWFNGTLCTGATDYRDGCSYTFVVQSVHDRYSTKSPKSPQTGSIMAIVITAKPYSATSILTVILSVRCSNRLVDAEMFSLQRVLTLWCLLLPHGHIYKASCARPG